jgi:hypothetical protein
LFVEQGAGQRGHRLRDVVRVLQHLADARGGGAIAVGFVGIGLDADGRQLPGCFLRGDRDGQRRGAGEQQGAERSDTFLGGLHGVSSLASRSGWLVRGRAGWG